MKRIKTMVVCGLLAFCGHAMADRYIDESEKTVDAPSACDADPACLAQVARSAADRAALSQAAEKDWAERPIEKTLDILIGLGLAGGLVYFFFLRSGPKSKKEEDR